MFNNFPHDDDIPHSLLNVRILDGKHLNGDSPIADKICRITRELESFAIETMFLGLCEKDTCPATDFEKLWGCAVR